MLIDDLDVRVIHATTGEIIRALTINPNAATTAPDAPSAAHADPTDPEKNNHPNPERRFGPSGMSRDITVCPRQDSNLRPTV